MRLRILLAALSDPRGYRRHLRLPWAMLIVSFLVAIGVAVGGGYALWANWTALLIINTSGMIFFPTVIEVLVLVLVYSRIPLEFGEAAYLFTAGPFTLAYAMRSALAAGFDAVAPVLAQPPTADATALGELLDASQAMEPRVVAIPAPLLIARGSVIGLHALGALLLLSSGGAAALATVIFNAPIEQVPSLSWGLPYLVVVCGGLLLLSLLAFARAISLEQRRRLQKRGMAVSLDSLGLCFHQPVWEIQPRQLAWTELRALASFTYKDWSTRTHTIYILTSDEQALVWEEPPTERYAAEPAQQRTTALQRSAWDLAAIVTHRTGLPVRDLTASVATLTGKSDTTHSGFLRDAYDMALLEEDVPLATALWRWQSLGVGRLPFTLRKLIAAPLAPSAPTPAEADTSAVPARFAKVSEQFNAARKAILAKQALLCLARALLPYAPGEDAAEMSASFNRFLRLERLRRRLSQRFSALTLGACAVILVLAGVYWASEQALTSRLSAIGPQTISQQPTYFASLASPLSDWPVHAPTAADPSSAIFINGGYQVSSSDANAPAQFWIPQQVHGDVAISLTMRVTNPVAQNYLLLSGMLFDVAENGSAYSMFGVDGYGNWILSRVDATRAASDSSPVVAIGSDAAIHTGEGATNTLLLVRHGPLYLLYANGVLISRSFDSKRMLGSSGDVGVYIEDGSVTARFNDFAIYPIPPQLAALSVPAQLPPWLHSN
jgi:hypothetical protein